MNRKKAEEAVLEMAAGAYMFSELVVPKDDKSNTEALHNLEFFMDMNPKEGSKESKYIDIQSTLIQHYEEKYDVKTG